MQVLSVVLYTIVSVSGITLVELGNQYPISIGIDHAQATFSIGWTTLCGMFLYVISFLVYMTLIAKNNLTYITPITTGLTYILTMIVSLVIFKEQCSLPQAVGIVLIISGVMLMNVKK